MPGLVHVEAPVGLLADVLVDAALEQAELDQARGDHAHRGIVIGDEWAAGAHFGDRRALRGEHNVVQRALCRREAAVDRKRARDVGGVALVFGAGVDQQQIAVVAAARCSRGSAARSHSRRRRRSVRTMAPRRGGGRCAAVRLRSRARSCRAASRASRASAPRWRSSPPCASRAARRASCTGAGRAGCDRARRTRAARVRPGGPARARG